MHQRHDWELQTGFNPRYQQNFSVGIFQDLSTLEDSPIPETMQGISTSAESKDERSKKKKNRRGPKRGLKYVLQIKY